MDISKTVLLLILTLALSPSLAAAQDIEVWTDHDTVNADGDNLKINYLEANPDNITKLEVNVSNKTVKSFNSSKDNIFLSYNETLTGSENLSIQLQRNNSDWSTYNIKEDLTRYQVSFNGFYNNSNKITRQLYYRELDEVTAKVSISKTNGKSSSNAQGLLGEDFEVTAEESKGELKVVGSSSSPYSLKFSGLPKMNPGKKRFTLKMKNGPKIENFNVEKRVAFQGRILGLTGSGKKATFELSDESIKTFETDNNGNFLKLFDTRSVEKKMKLYLGDVTTTFSGIEVDSDKDENIRYEYYKGLNPEEVDTKKPLRPINLIAFDSNYPLDIDETSVKMKYNSSGINPEDVEFYECTYWDFLGQECRVDWEEKEDVENNELLTEATIEDLETEGDGNYGLKSAYMAAVEYEKPSIELKNKLIENTSRNIEDELVIEGTLISNKDSKPVGSSNVQVELFNKDNLSIKRQKGFESSSDSGKDGFFTFTPIEIPDKAGNYTLRIDASKKGYNNLTYVKDILVNKKTSINVEKSGSSQLEPGETNSIVFTIRNTGQSKVQNILINETNIDEEYYTKTPGQIDEIDYEDSKTVTFSFILPENYCESNDCSKDVSITAKGQGNNLEKEVKATSKLNIKQPETARNEGKNQEENTGTENTNSKEKDDKEETSNTSEIKQLITGSSVDEESTKAILTFTALTLLTIIIGIKRKKKNNEGIKIRRKNKPHITLKVGESMSDKVKKLEKTNRERDEQQISHKKKISTSELPENKNKEDRNDDNVCEKCGEEFDTAVAFDFHREHQH